MITSMPAFTFITSLVLTLFSLAIIIVILLQEGHSQNVGAISGGADSFLSKNSARTIDRFLAKWTKFIAIAFFVLTIVCDVIVFVIK